MQADLDELETPEWTGDNDAAGRASKVIDQTLSGPELMADDNERWPLADAHAAAALTVINQARGGNPAALLGTQSSYYLMLGLLGGFRLCLHLEYVDDAVAYVQVDTEPAKDVADDTFHAIINIVSGDGSSLADVLGEEVAASFEGKNALENLADYLCDAWSAAAVPRLLQEKRTAASHIKARKLYNSVNTFRTPILKMTNIPEMYNFYDEYPECEVSFFE